MAASSPQIALVAPDGQLLDAFDVVALTEHSLRIRTAWRFELGEELTIRVTSSTGVTDVRAKVARHTRQGDDVITAIDLLEQQPIRRVVTG
jgi:hypothetical protein